MAKTRPLVGRPTKYEGDITVQKVYEYVESCGEDGVEEFHKTRGEKSDSYDRIVKVTIPTIEGLAVYLGVNEDTIREWRKEEDKKAFSVAVDYLFSVHKKRLIQKGLSGEYNSSIVRLLLAPHGYREQTEIMGQGGAPLIPQESVKEMETLAGMISDQILGSTKKKKK